MTPRFASRIAIANSVLVGWNSGLLCAFLIAILTGVMFNTFADGIDDSWRIATAILVAVIVGIFCGHTVARHTIPWFLQLKPGTKYLWLFALALFTALSFPVPFGYIAYST